MDHVVHNHPMKSFKNRIDYCMKSLEILDMDMWSPEPSPPIYGHKYYLMSIQDLPDYIPSF